MHRHMKWCLVGLVLGAGCSRPALVRVGSESRVSSLFEGFVYAGEDVIPQSHYSLGLPVPAQFRGGHKYTFHHETQFDSVDFAREVLPVRLQRIGFLLTKSVDFGQGPYVVEPATVWSVEFARGSCRGTIFSDVCQDLTKRRLFKDYRLEEVDYKLKLQGDCTVQWD